jgi:hypothetical protein
MVTFFDGFVRCDADESAARVVPENVLKEAEVHFRGRAGKWWKVRLPEGFYAGPGETFMYQPPPPEFDDMWRKPGDPQVKVTPPRPIEMYPVAPQDTLPRHYVGFEPYRMRFYWAEVKTDRNQSGFLL